MATRRIQIMLTDKQRALVEENIGLAYYCAHQMKMIPLDLEERISAALLGLTKAAASYDPQAGARFATYAVRVIQNEIGMSLRKERKHLNVVSLSTPIEDVNHWGGVLEDLVPDKTDHIGEWESFLDAEILLEKLDGFFRGNKEKLYRELRANPGRKQDFYANRMGTSQSYVSRMMRSMREDVRRELL